MAIATGAVALWRYTPLSTIATPGRLASSFSQWGDAPWAPAVAIGAFVVGGLVVFPLVVLVGATGIVFPPFSAFAISLAGALLSASLLYLLGARFLGSMVKHAAGPRIERVAAVLDRGGVAAVAAIRMLPIAPFSFVNLAAGSLGVRFGDYVIGTALGLAPGIAALTALGTQLRALYEHPTPARLVTLAVLAAAWIGLSLVLQRVIARRRKR